MSIAGLSICVSHINLLGFSCVTLPKLLALSGLQCAQLAEGNNQSSTHEPRSVWRGVGGERISQASTSSGVLRRSKGSPFIGVQKNKLRRIIILPSTLLLSLNAPRSLFVSSPLRPLPSPVSRQGSSGDVLDSCVALFLSGMYLPAPPVMGALGAEVKCVVGRTRGQRDRAAMGAGS